MTNDLHDDFLAVDLAAIDRFLAERRQEDLRLDFKQLARSPEFDKSDKRNLAKAVSGFANSDGGLIIWGVEARKDADEVDAASAKRPIPSVDAAHSKILSLTGEATGPLVDGVEHRVIHEGADEGYIVTYVPRSDSGPHMARLGEGRYYKRSGDSFYPLEHFDLEDMFGRRPKPKLEIATHVLPAGGVSGSGTVQVFFDVLLGIRNVGRGIARFPFLKLLVNAPHAVAPSGLDGNSRFGLPVRPRINGAQLPAEFYGGANDVVHPGDEIYIAKIRGGFIEGGRTGDVSAHYWIGADGHPMRGDRILVPASLIHDSLER